MVIRSEAIDAVANRRASSLTAIVQSELERMIVGGDLKSGERLNERQLASKLGVSRGPVREALQALERGGLVVGITNLGKFVRQVSVREAIEMYEMRGVIFGFACARLAEKITSEQNDVLVGLVGKMDDAIGADDPLTYFRLNIRFHDAIMEFADHERANTIYQQLVKEGNLLRERSLQPVESMQQSNAEHKVIIAAAAAGDSGAARIAAEEHHTNGKKRWLKTLES